MIDPPRAYASAWTWGSRNGMSRVRHIATGGMASVFCARDLALGRNVAIKLLAERFAHDEHASERFMREARAAARLSGHPNVVMTYDVGETEPVDGEPARAFIVMEYLAGGTVADALRVDSVRRVHTVKWVHEAASALDYAHGRGVLHRDIKPGNLLLTRDRVLRVGDFGIARLGTEDTITATGQVMGTASYLAPERALGRPATDASDRYSLAVAAYELLVGERPFTASHFAVQARQHVEDEPPAASSRNRALPPAVDAVLARGMAKRPEQRWPTAQAFAEALEAALNERAAKPLRTAAVAAGAARRGSRAARPGAGARSRGRERAHCRRRTGAGRDAIVPASPRWPRWRRAPWWRRWPWATSAVAVQRPTHSSASAQRPHATKATHKAARPRPAPRATKTVTVTPAAATTPPPVAETLDARGHQLMLNGKYSAAIPVLRQAVSAASHASLTYAYALFDLGRSLRLAGDPKDAVAVLYERLQIPNQTEAVREQLQLALLALGQQAGTPGGTRPAGGPPPPPGAARDHGGRDPHVRGGGAGPAGEHSALQPAVLPAVPSGHGPPRGD